MERETLRGKKEEEVNPREEANWLSVITFFYNYKILKKGKQKDLEDGDIYRVLPEFRAEALGDRLETEWLKDRKNGTKLWATLVKCFGLAYLVYTIVQLAFGTVIILYQPKVFSKFVAYFEPNQTDISVYYAYLYSAGIGGFLLLSAIYLHNFSQLVTEYSMKVRTAVCSLIFRKAMRLSPVAFAEITVGKTVTLMSKDIYALDAALAFIKDMIIGFLQLSVVTFILYQQVGYAALPPIAVILLIIPIQLVCGRITSKVRLKTAKRTDERFKLTQEALSAIKTIKMYAWQKYFEKTIAKARLKETHKLAIVYYLKALIGWLGAFTINIAFYVLLVIYIAQGHVLQAETVYFVQQCLFTLRTAIMVSIPMGICNSADLMAAFHRIQSFLDAQEVPGPALLSGAAPPKIYLDQARVVVKDKCVLNSVSIALTEGGLLFVTGNLGSGKSVLLRTILGEYLLVGGRMEVNGSISYAPEEPWIFPSTIRQNILFGEPYNEKRYQEVLRVCALTYDISRLQNSDDTFVGDNGFKLSRGQQARISLARAVYRDSDIYLLDDCLSSLDNNVTDHIFKHCIQGLLKHKICVFVTNKVHLITQMGNNGNVLFLENGTTLTLQQQNGSLDKRITYYIDEEVNAQAKKFFGQSLAGLDEKGDDEDDDSDGEFDELLKKSDRLPENVYGEKKKVGRVLWSNYITYYKLMGGLLIFLYLLVAFAASQAALSLSDKLISVWVNLEPRIATYINTNQTNSTDYEEALESRNYYLNLYTMLIMTAMVLSIIRSYSTFFACLNAAKALHNRLVNAMLQASMTFFDGHYIGNIINRLSKDLYVIDEYMPFLIFDFLRLIFSFIGAIVLVASVNWLLLVPGLLLIIKLFIVQRLYLPTGRSLRRLEASSRSPIIGYLNAALEGLSIIRSSQQTNRVQIEFDRHQDFYTSVYYMNQTTMRFFAFLLELFGAFYTTGVLLKLLFFAEGESAGDVGLAVSQAMMLSSILQYSIKQIAELETVMTSVERVLEYSIAQQEKQLGNTPLGWPSKGHIKFNDVSLTYQEDWKRVLKNITFEVAGGSKIGIVGRTGAGKSSIVSTLFRLYGFEDYLKSHLTLIPQDPVLFSGTIRTNIDPFNKFTDEEIWNALEKVHMKIPISDLNQNVASSKTTFSSGEKQLLCLARALVQQSKIIILDEATANLDPETDLLLQRTVQDCFKRCTVIIVSHKLHSVIWCDKVVTLRDGEVVECGEPRALLRNKGGILFKLIREENFETFVRLTHI